MKVNKLSIAKSLKMIINHSFSRILIVFHDNCWPLIIIDSGCFFVIIDSVLVGFDDLIIILVLFQIVLVYFQIVIAEQFPIGQTAEVHTRIGWFSDLFFFMDLQSLLQTFKQ